MLPLGRKTNDQGTFNPFATSVLCGVFVCAVTVVYFTSLVRVMTVARVTKRLNKISREVGKFFFITSTLFIKRYEGKACQEGIYYKEAASNLMPGDMVDFKVTFLILFTLTAVIAVLIFSASFLSPKETFPTTMCKIGNLDSVLKLI